MKPTLFLRIASVLMAWMAIGHTSGGLSSWSPAGATDVLRAMGAFHFDVMGSSRTYLDFYVGFGWILGLFQAVLAILFWQVGTLAKAEAFRPRPLIASFLLATVGFAALSWRFFFLMPLVLGLAIAVCLALAYFAAGRTRTA